MSVRPFRVCPACGETDDQPEFWKPRCEASWWNEAGTPEGTQVVAVTRGATCGRSCPRPVQIVAVTGSVRGESCTKHVRAMIHEHLGVTR